MNSSKIPKQFDIIWMKAEPHAGHEVGGHDQMNPYRPYLVLSKQEYNASGMIEFMPITSHNRMLPPYNHFMIPVKTDYGKIHGRPIHGYIFTFQLGCNDYFVRKGQSGGIVGHMSRKLFPKVMYFVKHMFY